MHSSIYFYLLVTFGLLSQSEANVLENVNYFNVSDCLLFFAGDIYLVNVNGGVDILLTPKQTVDDSTCSDVRASFDATFTSNSSTFKDLKLSASFSLQKGYWKGATSNVSLTCPADNKDCKALENHHVSISWAGAPTNMSYKCVTPPLAHIIDTDGARTTWALKFNWLQIQAFTKSNGVFVSDVSDCVGFFTVPIWSILSVSLLFIALFGYGLSMVASIQPNELFDDPRGKLVQLGAND